MLAPAIVPTQQQELLLKAALLDGDAALDAWGRWKRLTGGIERHDHDSYRVIPLLYRRLAPLAPDDGDLQRLKGVYRHTWYLNQLRLREIERLLLDFERATIPTLLLKGAALIELYYRDLGVRPMTDVDVLVPFERQRDAYELLRAQGWTRGEHRSIPGRDLPFVKHAVVLERGDQRVDLHWHALRESGDDRDFWEASMPLTVGGAATRTLVPADQLLQIVVHGTSYWGAPMAWIADAATIVAATGDALDWEALTHRAAAKSLTLRTAAALVYLRDAFDAAIPAEAVAGLRSTRAALAERVEHRMLVRHSHRRVSWYVREWDRWRRLRNAPATNAPGLLAYLAAGRYMSRRALALHLGRSVVRVGAPQRSSSSP